MLRVAHNACGGPDLDQLTVVQHGQPVGDLVGDAEIVGDQQHRAAEVGAQFTQQVQQLRLHGHIQGGGGFVGDDQTRAAGDGDRRHHPLPQPAGQFVRVDPQPQFGVADPDGFQQPDGLGVVVGDLTDLPADPHRRVQRRHRVLEDGAELLAADPAQLGRFRPQHVHPIHGDRPVGVGV